MTTFPRLHSFRKQSGILASRKTKLEPNLICKGNQCFIAVVYLGIRCLGYEQRVNSSSVNESKLIFIFSKQTSESWLVLRSFIDRSPNAVWRLALDGEMPQNYENRGKLSSGMT